MSPLSDKGNAEGSDGWETDDSQQKAKKNGPTSKDLDKRPPFEYYCITRPEFDLENENNDKEEDEQLDEEELEELFDKINDPASGVLHKPATDHPDHQWIAMARTWTMYHNLFRRAASSDPDNFGMYIYNDFHGYGLQEVIENVLVDFNKEVVQKDKDELAIKQMWAIMAALGHWLIQEDMVYWIGMDDGHRMCATVGLIGCAFLEMLNELDLAGKLRPDSDIKDLGLVISVYLNWGKDHEDIDAEELEWRKHVIAYAKKAELDLEESGCYGMGATLESFEEEYGEIEALTGAAKTDMWKWKKTFKDFGKEYAGSATKLGGEKYNILKMSRRDRAKHAFDKKDPFAGISDKDLKEGNLTGYA